MNNDIKKYLMEKRAILGMLGRGALWGAKMLGRGAVSTAALPIKGYGKLLAAKPISTVVGTAGTYMSTPYLASRFRGDRYNQLVNSYTTPNQQMDYRLMNFGKMSSMKKEGSFSTVLESLKKATGLSTPQIMLMAGASAIGAPLITDTAKNLLSPTTKQLGTNLHAGLFSPESRLMLSDIERMEEAKSRSKAIGLENAQSLIAEQAKKELEKREIETLSKARTNILSDLKREDPIINKGMSTNIGSRIVTDTMKTVTTFAPTLTTDKNTVRAVLREALTSPEAGLSYQTIKQLADTQRSINESSDPNTIYAL